MEVDSNYSLNARNTSILVAMNELKKIIAIKSDIIVAKWIRHLTPIMKLQIDEGLIHTVIAYLGEIELI